jgi:chemotaxis protein CheY-P-specific phosphatase CheC
MTTTTFHFSQTLAREASDTLEKLAFLFAHLEEDRTRFEDAEAVAARVDFSGPFNGSLLLLISSTILQELATNMLGIDEDDPVAEGEKHDAFKEALNVICGNLLPAIAGREAVFDIAAPQMAAPAREPDIADDRPPVGVARLGLDQGSCDLFFFVDGGLPEGMNLD